jgi:hypothetical protein
VAKVEGLLVAYERFVSQPWAKRVSAEERVWFALYEPREERRLRVRLGAFEEATVRAGHDWTSCDLTDEFARWMATQEYRESYFESPEDLTVDLLDDFADHTAGVVRSDRTLGRRAWWPCGGWGPSLGYSECHGCWRWSPRRSKAGY